MELRDFAETLLFAVDIESKLLRPKQLTDAQPGAALKVLPALPGRPQSLRFLELGESRPIAARFPSASVLKDDRERGRVMHFFANHELLALELMALMLLRFPEAPAAFRLCLAGTILDEQKHLGLYLQRMTALGVAIGDLPCGRFFWDSLQALSSPREFLAGMSLTFEQANLDFSLHYLNLMAEHDDHESREILQQVHDDEVRHLRRGLELFRGNLGDAELFADYQRALKFPLGAHHGKGRPFSRASRQAAGLPQEFIDEMEALAGSRGRPPALHFFNPAVEAEIAGRGALKIVRQVETDLGLLPALQASADDIVLVQRRPSLPLRLSLVRAGFEAVEWQDLETAAKDLAGRPLAALQAFGPSPRSAALARSLSIDEVGCLAAAPFSKSFDLELRHELEALLWGRAEATNLAWPQSQVCESLDQVDAAVRQGPSIVKANLSSAGRGSFRCPDAVLTASQATRTEALLAESGSVVVESLLTRVVDLSLHLDIEAPGVVRRKGLVRFYTDRQGQFLAAETAMALTTLSREEQRFLAGEGRQVGWFDRLQDLLMEVLAQRFATSGRMGPVGIDMMLHRDAEEALKLQPLVEFNPRLTMGRLAWAAGRRIKRGRQGLLVIAAKKAGHDDISALAGLANRRPLACDPQSGLIDEGILLLGEHLPTTQFLPLLAVGAAREEAVQLLRLRALAGPASGLVG